MTVAKTQQGGEKYSWSGLLIVIISKEISVGKGKHRAIFSNSLNREAEEKKQVGGGGFGAHYVPTSVSHGNVM